MTNLRWTIEEIFYELDEDPDRLVLFVEGNADEIFWKTVCPISSRNDGVVYPSCVVEIEGGVLGGERGRLLRFAEIVAESRHANRIRFFVDADYDRVTGVPEKPLVWLTDGRDLEGYFLAGAGVELLFAVLLGRDNEAEEFRVALRRTALPIAITRITSVTEQLSLPFQSTLTGRISRFLTGRSLADVTVDEGRLCRSLCQSVGMSGPDQRAFLASRDNQTPIVEAMDLHQTLHGKDVVAILAWAADVPDDAAVAYIRAGIALDVEAVRMMPNISAANEWLCQAA